MSDKFDPSEFDAPFEPDPFVLIEAMKQAAVSGVQAATGPLLAGVEASVRRQMRGYVLRLMLVSFAVGLALAGASCSLVLTPEDVVSCLTAKGLLRLN